MIQLAVRPTAEAIPNWLIMVMLLRALLPKPTTVVNVVMRTGKAASVLISRRASIFAIPTSSLLWYSEIMWVSSVKPMAIIRAGTMAVITLIGMSNRTIRPSTQIMLTRPVIIGMTQAWKLRNEISNVPKRKIMANGTRLVTSAKIKSP